MLATLVSEIVSGGPPASVYALGGVGATTLIALLGGLLIAVVGGVLLLRRRKKAAEEFDSATETQTALEPSIGGGLSYEAAAAKRSHTEFPNARVSQEAREATIEASRDPGLAKLFVELGVKEEHGLSADCHQHDDEEAIRAALMRAAEGHANGKNGSAAFESELPMVEATAVEEVVEVEAVAVDELPMVEAAAEEVSAGALAEESASETVEVEAKAVEADEISEVVAEAVETVMVEAEPKIEEVGKNTSEEEAVEVETAMVEAAPVEEAPVEAQAAPVEEQEETMPVVGAEPAAPESVNQIEFEVEEAVPGMQEAAAMEADGQTTFFTFEDLNFQPAEDAKPGEDGLGLSLEEAAAVLASEGDGASSEKKQEPMPRMEQIFPALVNDEGPEVADSIEGERVAGAEGEAVGSATSNAPRVAPNGKSPGRGSRLKRITLGVPVLVRGPKADPSRLREVTQTMVVLPQGAVLSMGAKIGLGEELNLVNLKTGDEVECRVVGMKLGDDGKNHVEIEFLQDMTSFWPVSFPGEAVRNRGREGQLVTAQK